MFFAPHATFELKEVNYNTFCIKNVPCIPSTFDGDVLFELPPINNPNGHFVKCKGWIESMTVIFGVRSKQHHQK
jgi:hypothetical protein